MYETNSCHKNFQEKLFHTQLSPLINVNHNVAIDLISEVL